MLSLIPGMLPGSSLYGIFIRFKTFEDSVGDANVIPPMVDGMDTPFRKHRGHGDEDVQIVGMVMMLLVVMVDDKDDDGGLCQIL